MISKPRHPTIVTGVLSFAAGACAMAFFVLEQGPFVPPAPQRAVGVQRVAVPSDPPPAPAPRGTAGEVADVAEELVDRNLAMPVEGVQRNALVDSFHDDRSDGRKHEALDILAPRNTAVLAVEDGVIAKLFTSAQGGLTIYQFDPSGEFVYYYAHLERYAENLNEGDRVRRGQVIGYVGTSGNAPRNTPHLHFAIFKMTPEKHWREGTPIDPFDILRQTGRR